MNEIVNLNRARKTRAREEKRAQADANAVKHGRTKAERIFDAARSEQARRILDQHHMDEE
ncbi:DUF4169 family protein [Profundibacter sp.]